MKGQISLIESIVVSIILLISFNILITPDIYQSKWSDSILSLNGRDSLVTIERLGRLHDYTFSSSKLNSEFLSRLETTKDSIIKIEAKGTVKETINIACDCTQEQITYLRNLLLDVKVNDRLMKVNICESKLNIINSCTSTQLYPDILIIWGYKNLQADLSSLIDLINNGTSIIEISDINTNQEVDLPHQRIFGLRSISEGNFPSNPSEFLRPRNVSVIKYQSYKWFYHLPYVLKGTTTASIPVEGGISSCILTATTGNFRFQGTNRKFWICGTNSVYFDTNSNNIADLIVFVGNRISINTHNFKLNYIDDESTIRISFKPDYTFSDFVSNDNSKNKLFPIDNNKDKILLVSGYWDLDRERPISVAIFNGTENIKTLWLADFSRGGLVNTDDDHKQLITSLIFSMVSKETIEQPTKGQVTSYMNTINRDLFETYSVNLKITKPF